MLAKILFLTFFAQRAKNAPPPFEHLMKIFFRSDRRECRKKIINIELVGGSPAARGEGKYNAAPNLPPNYAVLVGCAGLGGEITHCSHGLQNAEKLNSLQRVGCRGFLRCFG